MSVSIDPTTMKYMIRAEIAADGVVEKPDVVGAIFGQTEGLLGNELDLRDLQKSGRIGRIEVEIDSKKGKSTGIISMPSSLDKVETAILAAALESIDRVGPCKADIKVVGVDDVRVTKRKQVVDRARQILQGIISSSKGESDDIMEQVRDIVRVQEIVSYGPDRCPAGPNISKSESIIIVEGRNDVLNLLKNGITNAIAVEGTSVPKTIVDLSKEKTAIAFVDGDRGGELILKELLQTAEVDFIARAPRAHEVEELTQKGIMKSLRNKIPAEQFVEMYSLEGGRRNDPRDNPRGRGPARATPDAELDDGADDALPLSPAEIEAALAAPEAAAPAAPVQERRDERRGERRDDRPAREERREPREAREERPPREERAPRREVEEPAPTPAGPRDEKATLYASTLDELSGKLQAVLFNDKMDRIGDRVAVRDLADTLKKEEQPVKLVVFDGVITQRLLDIAADKNIPTLVGVKTGNITKRPGNVEIVTRAEL